MQTDSAAATTLPSLSDDSSDAAVLAMFRTWKEREDIARDIQIKIMQEQMELDKEQDKMEELIINYQSASLVGILAKMYVYRKKYPDQFDHPREKLNFYDAFFVSALEDLERLAGLADDESA